jgi:hypothetical protein
VVDCRPDAARVALEGATCARNPMGAESFLPCRSRLIVPNAHRDWWPGFEGRRLRSKHEGRALGAFLGGRP